MLKSQVLDVERMMAKSQQSGDGHPVLRTLYDHHDVSPRSLFSAAYVVVNVMLVHFCRL